MKTLSLASLLLCLTIGLFAQNKYKKGTIKYKDSDVESEVYFSDAYIKDYKNFRNINQICFKNGLGDSTEYVRNIDAIESFSIDDRLFRVFTVGIRNSIQSIVAQVLEKGRLTLMYYRDVNGYEHIFVDKDGRIIKLLPEEEIVDHEFVRYKFEDTYVYKLWTLMQDANIEKDKLKNTPFNVHALALLVKEYNQGFENQETVSYKKSKDLVRVDPCIYVATNYSDARVTDQLLGGYEQTQLIGKEIGLKANIFLPNLSEYISFEPGILYGKKACEFDLNSAKFDLEYMEFQFMLKLNWKRWNIRPYFGIGMYNSLLFNAEESFSYIDVRNGERVYYDEFNYKDHGNGILLELAFNIIIKGKDRILLGFDYKNTKNFVRGNMLNSNGAYGAKIGFVF